MLLNDVEMVRSESASSPKVKTLFLLLSLVAVLSGCRTESSEGACTLENFIAVATAEDVPREIPAWDKSSKYKLADIAPESRRGELLRKVREDIAIRRYEAKSYAEWRARKESSSRLCRDKDNCNDIATIMQRCCNHSLRLF